MAAGYIEIYVTAEENRADLILPLFIYLQRYLSSCLLPVFPLLLTTPCENHALLCQALVRQSKFLLDSGLKLALPHMCGNITFYKRKAEKHPEAEIAHNVKYI